jgi:predicted CXXCH cytochrome family protein
MTRTTAFTCCSLTITIALSLILAGSGARAVEEDKTPAIWSTVPYCNWIKESAAPLEQFSFFINGAETRSSVVNAVRHQESLHLRFPLAYEAETLIEVRFQGASIYRAHFFYAPSYEKSIVPDRFTYLPFHTEEREQPCQKCHRLTVNDADANPPVVKEQLCYPCHQHMFDSTASRHKPAASQWRCLQCHLQKPSPSPWNADQPLKFAIADADNIAPLCYRCHKKFAAQVKGYDHQHGPMGMGACTVCHNPHASNFPKLLQNQATTLCVNCHEMQKTLQQPVVHQIIKDKGCTACHNPHGSAYPQQLPGTVSNLCSGCHPAIAKQANNHPVQGHPVFIKGVGKETKDRLTCTSCHSPHASAFPKLLPEEEVMMLCTHCHPMGTK